MSYNVPHVVFRCHKSAVGFEHFHGVKLETRDDHVSFSFRQTLEYDI